MTVGQSQCGVWQLQCGVLAGRGLAAARPAKALRIRLCPYPTWRRENSIPASPPTPNVVGGETISWALPILNMAATGPR
jgi:hypothetical protein